MTKIQEVFIEIRADGSKVLRDVAEAEAKVKQKLKNSGTFRRSVGNRFGAVAAGALASKAGLGGLRLAGFAALGGAGLGAGLGVGAAALTLRGARHAPVGGDNFGKALDKISQQIGDAASQWALMVTRLAGIESLMRGSSDLMATMAGTFAGISDVIKHFDFVKFLDGLRQISPPALGGSGSPRALLKEIHQLAAVFGQAFRIGFDKTKFGEPSDEGSRGAGRRIQTVQTALGGFKVGVRGLEDNVAMIETHLDKIRRSLEGAMN